MVCGEVGESVCGVWLVFGVLLPLEAVAELVENSRMVPSAWAHFLSLLDSYSVLYSWFWLCLYLTGEAFGMDFVAF